MALSLGLMSFNSISNSSVRLIAAAEKASISWKSETIDVHEIPQNKPKVIDFEFKNIGESPILITNVQGSCGCTATSYTKTPILPGETAKVTATYNAAIKGAFSKTVSVTTNSSETPAVLTLKGIVI